MIEQSKEDEEAKHRQPVSDEPIFHVQEKTLCPRAHPEPSMAASGRYLELHWWLAHKAVLSLPDFSSASQNAVAIR
ncbi:MAG: hypothetical protein WB679_05155 [Terracidiphilus sp.]